MLKVKFMQNTVMLYMTNSSLETLILNPKEALGILDLRLLGYYCDTLGNSGFSGKLVFSRN